MGKHVNAVTLSAVVLTLILSGCASSATRGIASAETGNGVDRVLEGFGLKAWYGNIHSHHYMKHEAPNRPHADDSGEDGEERSASCNVKGNSPEDDGKPCRVEATGKELYLTEERVREYTSDASLIGEEALREDPALLYFKMACDYAYHEGKLDVLFITPHSKNGEVEQDTSTLEEGFTQRAALLAKINASYGGRFYCGLGQEVSSISKGNHVCVFGHFRGHFREDGANQPFFFPTGAFDQFYREVAKRKNAGEDVILQFNHPDIKQDLWWGPFQNASKKKKKTLLNDYGLDDFAPVACVVGKKLPGCTPELKEISLPLLRETFAKIRETSNEAYSVMEIIPPLGATTNPGVDFKKVHHRMNELGIVASEVMKPHDGLYNYIFYLTMGFKLAPAGNQDNHFANWGSATSSRTGILAPSLAEKDIFEALSKRRTFATEDLNAKAVLQALDAKSGVKVLMGGEVVTAGDSITISVSYSDQDAIERDARVRFFYYRDGEDLDYGHRANPAGVFRTVTFGAEGAVVLPKAAAPSFSQIPGEADSLPIVSDRSVSVRLPLVSGGQFVFAEITQAGDADKVITAPIWIIRK